MSFAGSNSLFATGHEGTTEQLPAGYTAYKGAMDHASLKKSATWLSRTMFRANDYEPTHTQLNIEYGEAVFRIVEAIFAPDTDQNPIRANEFAPGVLSSLTGIEGLLKLEPSQSLTHAQLEEAIFDRISVLGISRAKHFFELNNGDDMRLFPIMFHGVITYPIREQQLYPGEIACWAVPQQDTINAPGYNCAENGTKGKVTLTLCPMKLATVLQYGRASYQLHKHYRRHLSSPDNLPPPLHTARLGYQTELSALLIGLHMLLRVTQAGYFIPNFGAPELFASDGSNYDKTIEPTNLDHSPYDDPSGHRLFTKAVDPRGRKEGIDQAAATKMGLNGDVDLDIQRVTRPETCVALLACAMGLISKESMTENLSDNPPDGYDISKYLDNSDYDLGNQTRELFLRGLFDRHAEPIAEDDNSQMSVLLGGKNKDLIFSDTYTSNGFTRTFKKNGWERLQNMFDQTWPNLLSATFTSIQTFSSRVLGKVLGGNFDTADVFLNQ